MKITYVTCDGITKSTEEIKKAELYEQKNFVTGKTTQAMECTRISGDTFIVDCEKVTSIIK